MSQTPSAVTHTIAASILGRYVVRAPSSASADAAPLLVGFHGYGESAEQHLEELVRIPGAAEWLIVSVQALHRFYRRKTGSVVASWMTSQDRDRMIEDNIHYVDSVVDAVTGGTLGGRPLVYGGFSQGVAMAYRAATKGKWDASGLVALGGDLPPELRGDTTLAWPRILVGRGANDTLYTPAAMTTDLAFLATVGCPLETVVFDGGHEWHDDFRQSASRLLASVRSDLGRDAGEP